MLAYTKKYTRIGVFLLAVIILFLGMILDMRQLCERGYLKYQKKLENSVVTQNLYIEVSKKFQNRITKESQKDTNTNMEDVIKVNIYRSNPWRIKIPKLRLDAPITEGTSAESLRRTVGHFEHSDKWMGNVCLAGHNRGYRCNFFGEIKDLKKGDIIIYCTEQGERIYRVTINTIIKETDWSYLKKTKDNRITLITCEINRREYRRCIQAVEVKK